MSAEACAAQAPWLSILLPTRGRPDFANRLLESIADTAERPGELEVLFYIDADDPESLARIGRQGLAVKKLCGPPGCGIGVMTNVLYRESRGAFVLLCGDDNVFRTPGWDARVRAEFARFPDGVALVYPNDLYQGEQICTAPFISREVCELMGGPCPPVYVSSYIDTHLLNIFVHLEHMGHKRRIYLPDVVLEHLHHLAGKAQFDETYARRMPAEQSHAIYMRLEPQRQKVIAALARRIRDWGKGAGGKEA